MAEATVKTDEVKEAGTPDLYHDHQKALDWALRLEAVSWVPLVLGVLALAFVITELYVYIPQTIGSAFMDVVLGLGITVLIPLTATIVCASLFVLLRATAQALLLLLDIQEGPSAS
jgi:hypothetical protein